MFRIWMNQVGGKLKWQVLAGAFAFCWAIWLSRTDVVFNKSSINICMQVLYMEHIGSTSGLGWKRMIKTERRSIWRVKN
jgi:hypothetical protein